MSVFGQSFALAQPIGKTNNRESSVVSRLVTHPPLGAVQYGAPHGPNLHLCWTLVFKNDLLISVAQWNS